MRLRMNERETESEWVRVLLKNVASVVGTTWAPGIDDGLNTINVIGKSVREENTITSLNRESTTT